MLNNNFNTLRDFVKPFNAWFIKITVVFITLMLLMTTGLQSPAFAAAGDETTPGSLSLVPTLECIGVVAKYTGDNNGNNSAILTYRQLPSGDWKTAPQMYTDRGSREYRGSIFWLRANTDYEVRVTYTDANGVSGTNPVTGTIKTRNDNPPSNGKTYYVATNGSDSSPGTEAQPFKTLQKAANSMSAGDTVLVKAGTYSSGASVTTSGSADNYITFKNYGSDTPILDGGDTAFFVEARFIRIKGFKCQNQYGSAITINAEHASAGDVIVEDCVIVNPNRNNTGSYGGIGLYYGASNCIIQRNHITIQGYANDKQGVAYWKAGDGHVFRDNVIDGIPHDGFGGGPENSHGYMRNCDYYNNYVENAQDDGISVEGDDINVRIWGNTMIKCFMSVAVCPVMIGPVYIYGNVMNAVMARSLGNGGAMKLGDGSEGPIYIYHNTMYATERGCDGPFATNAGLANVTSRNNIIYATWYAIEFGHDWDAENHNFDYDYIYSTEPGYCIKWGQAKYPNFSSFQSDTRQEQHGMWVSDPGLVNPAAGDFSLRADSICRDKGVVLPGFNDADSPWPYQGSAPDLGAREYNSGAPTNSPPVLGAIGNKSGNEGQLLTFGISATDPNGDALNYTASSLPSGASFNTGTGTFSWTPDVGQAGSYPNVRFEVTDGELTDYENITITIVSGNSPPVLGAIGNKSTYEGQPLTFNISATDPNGDTLIYTASSLPSGASFNAGTGTFSWTPAVGRAGSYPNVHFEVTDGELTDYENITITVVNGNGPPVLGAIGNKSANEGQLLTFSISASDPNGDTLNYSASSLPDGASFNTGTGTFSWTPDVGQAGSYPNVHFEVTDGELNDYENITITVMETLSLPLRVNAGGAAYTDSHGNLWRADQAYVSGEWGFYGTNNSVDRGTGLAISGTVDDRIYQTERYRLSGYRFDIGNGTYAVTLHFAETFRTSPGARVFDVTIEGQMVLDNLDIFSEVGYSAALTKAFNNITVQDGQLDIAFIRSVENPEINGIEIAVSEGNNEVNNPPVLGSIGDKTINESQLLSFTISATDPDGDALTYSVSNLPDGASFNSSTQTFSWTPDSGDAGSYSDIGFEVSDGALTDSEDITIIVTPASDGTPPQISDVSSTNIMGTSADIEWITDELSTSQVEYGASPTQQTPEDGSMVTSHVVHLNGLLPDTTYSYKVMSADTEGNVAVQEGGTFTTPQEEENLTAFSVSDLSVRPSTVYTGRRVAISVVVTNNGSTSGDYAVALKINGETEDTRVVTLDAGASRQVTFYTSKSDPGIYQVDVNGLTGSFEVKTARFRSFWGFRR